MEPGEDRRRSWRMICDSVAVIVPRKNDYKRIRALRFTDPGFDRAVWRTMCEASWPGLMVSSAQGGSGLGMQEMCALAGELGAGLVPEPLIPVAMAAQMLPREHLASVLSGERIVIPAWQEQANSIAFTGETRLDFGRLFGRKLFVPAAPGADAFLVSLPGGLALVERDAPGVRVDAQKTPDGGYLAVVAFDDAPAQALPGDGTAALDQAIMAHSAYLLGLTERAFAMTLDHLKEIDALQSSEDRVSDMQVQISLTRAVVDQAAYQMDNAPSERHRQAYVSRAKLRAADAAMMVTRAAVQLHGGIAYTDAADIGLFLRKAMVLCPLYGSQMAHRARFRTAAPETE